MNKKKIIILVIVAAILAVGGLMLTRGGGEPSDELVMEKAPGVPEEWIDAVGDGISFSYPEALETTFVGTMIWPPQGFLLGDGPITCEEATTAQAGQAVKKVIGGNTYCVTEQSEIKTSSTFTQYAYTFEKEGQVIALLFGLRFVKCEAQDVEKKAACEAEQKTFSIDEIANMIAQSFVIGTIEEAPDTSVVPEGV